MRETPGSQPYRIMLRPIANPLPVGLLALMICTVSVSALQLGWIPSGQSAAVGRIVVVLALTVQLPGAAFGSPVTPRRGRPWRCSAAPGWAWA